jgi:hypothetical protein
MNPTLKKIGTHLLVMLAFVGLAFLYASPLLEGKTLRMEDMTQVDGMSRELQAYKKQDGVMPKWTGILFGGMPAYQIQMEYPSMWITKVHAITTSWLPRPAECLFLLMAGFYLMLLMMGVGMWTAILGALAYALSSYNLIIIDAGHITKAWAIAYMPLVVGSLVVLFRGQFLAGSALLAFSMAMQLASYHYQITYYMGMLVVIFGIVEAVKAIKSKQIPRFATASVLALASVGLAVGANYSQFTITSEYSKESMRGGSELKRQAGEESGGDGLDKEYALRWSYGVGETFTLLIPNFYGGASQSPLGKGSQTYEVLEQAGVDRRAATNFVENAPTYFGDQPGVGGPTYFGALMIFLFVLGLIVYEGPTRWWLGAAALLSIVLSWGKNFELVTDLFFNHVPYYNKFRAVAMSLVIASLAVPLMAVLLLRRIELGQISEDKLYKGLRYASIATGGFCLIFLVMPGLFLGFDTEADSNFNNIPGLVDALMEDRASMVRRDAFKSLFLIAIGAATLFYHMKKRLSTQNMIWILLAANTIDLWVTDRRYLNSDDFQNARLTRQPFEPTAADQTILQDTNPHYRVLDMGNRNPFNENRASYFHKSVGGYSPAKLSRYEDVKVKWLETMNEGLLNAFNTRWIIIPTEGGAPVAQLRPQAYGPAWLVNNVLPCQTPQQEVDTLGVVDLRSTVVINRELSTDLAASYANDSTASIQLTSYHPDTLRYAFTGSTKQFAVFSEMYYDKGWNAYLDGRPVPHKRVNYTFRGLELPAGAHNIEFRFEPATYLSSERISFASSIALTLLGLVTLLIALLKPHWLRSHQPSAGELL